MMASFYYSDQSSLRFCIIMKIMVIVVLCSLGLLDLNMKGKTQCILVIVVK